MAEEPKGKGRKEDRVVDLHAREDESTADGWFSFGGSGEEVHDTADAFRLTARALELEAGTSNAETAPPFGLQIATEKAGIDDIYFLCRKMKTGNWKLSTVVIYLVKMYLPFW